MLSRTELLVKAPAPQPVVELLLWSDKVVTGRREENRPEGRRGS